MEFTLALEFTFSSQLLNCCLTAWSGTFGVWQEGRICGEVGLGIRFLDATEEGGHSLSTEKFAS